MDFQGPCVPTPPCRCDPVHQQGNPARWVGGGLRPQTTETILMGEHWQSNVREIFSRFKAKWECGCTWLILSVLGSKGQRLARAWSYSDISQLNILERSQNVGALRMGMDWTGSMSIIESGDILKFESRIVGIFEVCLTARSALSNANQCFPVSNGMLFLLCSCCKLFHSEIKID